MAKLLSGTRIYGTATIDTQLFITGTTSATSTTTGALIVSGGIGIGGSLYAGNIYSNGTLVTGGGSSTGTTSTFIISNTTTSTSTTTGALVVSGGVGIGGSLYVRSGITATNITLTGLTANRVPFVSTGGLLIDNANFYVDNVNALFYAGGGGAYIGGTGGFGTVSSTVALFNTSTVSGFTARLNVSGVSYLGGNLYVTGATTVTNTTAATSTFSGALVVSGGAGIGGSLYAGNIYSNGTLVGGGATISNDTSTNTSQYIGMYRSISGSTTTVYVSDSKLYFNPSSGTLNSTIFNSLSDSTRKANIHTITNAVNTVNNIEGVEFTWIDNGKKSAGVVAQQLEQVLPWLIDTAEDGLKSVNYNGIIGYLINAVKELDSRVQELENR